MSRARRAPLKVKPCVADGFRFASAAEAGRYEGLKSYVREHLTVTKSTDGSRLVCEWPMAGGPSGRKNVQTFTLAVAGPNKYNAQKVALDGFTFDSGREAKRYIELKHLLAARQIRDLVVHPPPFDLVVNGVKIGRYTADFGYSVVATNKAVIEDAKSEITRQARDYPLRKKLMLACHGIAVAEV